jgi:hypothetical protein
VIDAAAVAAYPEHFGIVLDQVPVVAGIGGRLPIGKVWP